MPLRKEVVNDLTKKLNLLEEAHVHGVGEKGIAVVLDTENLAQLKKVSKEISEWTEVADFSLAYVNYEDTGDTQ